MLNFYAHDELFNLIRPLKIENHRKDKQCEKLTLLRDVILGLDKEQSLAADKDADNADFYLIKAVPFKAMQPFQKFMVALYGLLRCLYVSFVYYLMPFLIVLGTYWSTVFEETLLSTLKRLQKAEEV